MNKMSSIMIECNLIDDNIHIIDVSETIYFNAIKSKVHHYNNFITFLCLYLCLVIHWIQEMLLKSFLFIKEVMYFRNKYKIYFINLNDLIVLARKKICYFYYLLMNVFQNLQLPSLNKTLFNLSRKTELKKKHIKKNSTIPRFINLLKSLKYFIFIIIFIPIYSKDSNNTINNNNIFTKQNNNYSFPKKGVRHLEECTNKITLIVKVDDTENSKQIFSNDFPETDLPMITDIVLNGVSKGQPDSKFVLISQEGENTVEICFGESSIEQIDNHLFGDINGIISIDLSEFVVTSQTSLSSAFSYCFDLKSINLNGFIKSPIEDLSSMFLADTKLDNKF